MKYLVYIIIALWIALLIFSPKEENTASVPDNKQEHIVTAEEETVYPTVEEPVSSEPGKTIIHSPHSDSLVHTMERLLKKEINTEEELVTYILVFAVTCSRENEYDPIYEKTMNKLRDDIFRLEGILVEHNSKQLWSFTWKNYTNYYAKCGAENKE